MLIDKIRDMVNEKNLDPDTWPEYAEMVEAFVAVDDVLKVQEQHNKGNIFTSGMVSIKLIRKAMEDK